MRVPSSSSSSRAVPGSALNHDSTRAAPARGDDRRGQREPAETQRGWTAAVTVDVDAREVDDHPGTGRIGREVHVAGLRQGALEESHFAVVDSQRKVAAEAGVGHDR